MSLVEGLGDEVTVTVLLLIVLSFIGFFIFSRFCSTGNENSGEDFVEGEDNPPPVHNPHTCPICWGEQVMPLETNCGHLYCGLCLHTLYNQNEMNSIVCPMCRQEVTLLFKCFSNVEKNAPEESEVGRLRCEIAYFAGVYNRRHSGGQRSIWEQLRDAPILLRHFFIDGSEDNNSLYPKLLLITFISALYLIIPTDVIPEQVFGILGLIDDIIVLGFLILYFTSIYRRFLADRPLDENSL